MASAFPNAVAQYPTYVDLSDTVFAQHVNTLHDEIIAIETALGTNPAGSAGTVGARVAAVESTANDYATNGAKTSGDQTLTGTKTFPNLRVGGLGVTGSAGMDFIYQPPGTQHSISAAPQASFLFSSKGLFAGLGYGSYYANLVDGPLRQVSATSDRYYKGQFTHTWNGNGGLASAVITLPDQVPVSTLSRQDPTTDGAQLFLQLRLIVNATVPHTVVISVANIIKNNNNTAFTGFTYVISSLTGTPQQNATSTVDYLLLVPGPTSAVVS